MSSKRGERQIRRSEDRKYKEVRKTEKREEEAKG